MGFRFYRRIRIAPGLSINLGKKGASVSVGPRGAKMTVGPNGTRTSVGIPGTGIYYEKRYGKGSPSTPATSGSSGFGCFWGVIILIVVGVFFVIVSDGSKFLGELIVPLMILGAVVVLGAIFYKIFANDSGSENSMQSSGYSSLAKKRSSVINPASNKAINELAVVTRSFYDFLKKLNRSTRVRNILNSFQGMDNVGKNGNSFSINPRLGLIAYCDVRAIFRNLGYNEGCLSGLSGVGYAMFVLLVMLDKDFDLLRLCDSSQRDEILKIVSGLADTTKLELDIEGRENDIRFGVMFGDVKQEHELVVQYATHLYRWASLLAKADGVITAKESEVLASIMKLRDASSIGNVSIQNATSIDRAPANSNKEEEMPSASQVKSSVESLEEALKTLEDLIGLSPVKQDVKTLVDFIKIQRKRKEAGLKETPLSYHCVFTGNPGAGKTTVARILADIYRELGIVKKGHLVETDRSGLVAEYVGQTAVKTNKIIDSALDGVLFIGEAYTLVQGGDKDYGSEAIATLLKRMEDNRDRLVVILAGYTEQMKMFIDSNPGLHSRFSRYINFPDYSADELAKIFLLRAENSQYVCDSDVQASIVNIMERAVMTKDKNFGNGRFVRNLFEKAIQRQAARLATVSPITTEMLTMLTLHDLGFEYEE